VAVDRKRIEDAVREVLRERDRTTPEGTQVSQAARPGTKAGRDGSEVRTVALGSDHGGFALKEMLRRYLSEELGYVVKDVGTTTDASCDYPDYAVRVAEAVANGECDRGIMIDGAGIGSSMAANRIPGVLAACCHDIRTVVNSREHNGANVLTMGSGVVGRGLARQMVKTWLRTPFGGGRHERRVQKILDLERRWTGKS
jgi:ribose 5-phosphate isomerase B